MKEDKNSVTNQHACHYITFNTVDWVDVFIKLRLQAYHCEYAE